jgi:hypothetical protein
MALDVRLLVELSKCVLRKTALALVRKQIETAGCLRIKGMRYTETPNKIKRMGLIVLERLVEPAAIRNCRGIFVVAATLRRQQSTVGDLLVV